VSKMEGRTIFFGVPETVWWLDLTDPSTLFYDASTPLPVPIVRATDVEVAWHGIRDTSVQRDATRMPSYSNARGQRFCCVRWIIAPVNSEDLRGTRAILSTLNSINQRIRRRRGRCMRHWPTRGVARCFGWGA